ncbi:protein YahM, partial [Shigella sonnei]
MAVQLFKTLLNQIPLLSSLQSGTLPLFGYSGRVRPMKKA